MARTLSQRAHDAVESLQHVPVRVIDRVFAGFATLASVWLAFLLVYQLVTAGWRHLWAFVPFWVLVTYLILPRVHSVLSKIYLPDYFIGRTRTREGVLGDPVNLALQGSEEQIHAAMLRAGWRRADELNVFTGWRTVYATLRRLSYPEAPVSALFLFGTRQAFTYQQEVEGNPAKRHHVRFWATPEGWLLPGGHQVEWLAAGTFDRAVGLSLFTGQITHRIDADIDAERDHILATVTAPEAGNAGVTVELIRSFASGYHHRNGGGDRITTDGDMPIIDLRRLAPASEEVRSQILKDDTEAAYRRPVPLTVAFGVATMILRVVLGVLTGGLVINPIGAELQEIDAVRSLIDGGMPVAVVYLVPGLLFSAMLAGLTVCALFVYRGRVWARTWGLVLSTAGVLTWAALWFGDAVRGAAGLGLIATALEILVILALSSDSARIYVAANGRLPQGRAEALRA